MSSVRLKMHMKIPCSYEIHIHIASCFEEYENKRAKIRRFTLQIHMFFTNIIDKIKHKYRNEMQTNTSTELNKEQSHNRDLRGFF